MWDQHAWAAYAWAEHSWLGVIIEESIKFGAEIYIPGQIRDIAVMPQVVEVYIMGQPRLIQVPQTTREINV
jgi:hypothetical protein